MNIVRVVAAAGISWLVPLVTAFTMYGRDGQLMVSYWLFKAAMIVVLVVTALVSFRWVYAGWIGPLPGLGVWFAIGLAAITINIGLDVPTVMRLQQTGLKQYAIEVGVVYLIFIVVSIVMGAGAAREVVNA